jgi:hypothetical protein
MNIKIKKCKEEYLFNNDFSFGKENKQKLIKLQMIMKYIHNILYKK